MDCTHSLGGEEFRLEEAIAVRVSLVEGNDVEGIIAVMRIAAD